MPETAVPCRADAILQMHCPREAATVVPLTRGSCLEPHEEKKWGALAFGSPRPSWGQELGPHAGKAHVHQLPVMC